MKASKFNVGKEGRRKTGRPTLKFDSNTQPHLKQPSAATGGLLLASGFALITAPSFVNIVKHEPCAGYIQFAWLLRQGMQTVSCV
jgi:hypothetical protein